MTDTTTTVEGFAMIPRAIQRNPDISGTAKLVYLALSSRANASLEAWPSHTSLASEASCSVSSVQRALNELKALGLISWTQRHGEGTRELTSNIYRLGGSGHTDRTPSHTDRTGPVTLTGPSGHSDRGTRVTGTRVTKNERETLSPSSTLKNSGDKRTPITADFAVTDDMREWTRENRRDLLPVLDKVTAKFIEHHRSEGTLKVDWLVAWRKWVRDEHKLNASEVDIWAGVPVHR